MSEPSKYDPTETVGKSYAAESKDDVDSALWYLTLFHAKGDQDIFMLIKARKHLDMAISRHNESEKLLGNTLEPYVEEEQKT